MIIFSTLEIVVKSINRGMEPTFSSETTLHFVLLILVLLKTLWKTLNREDGMVCALQLTHNGSMLMTICRALLCMGIRVAPKHNGV
jgi:hypothetical protein